MYLKLEDIEDGNKGFGVNDGGVMGQSGDNSGFNVVARTIDHLEKKKKKKIRKSHPQLGTVLFHYIFFHT